MASCRAREKAEARAGHDQWATQAEGALGGRHWHGNVVAAGQGVGLGELGVGGDTMPIEMTPYESSATRDVTDFAVGAPPPSS